MKLAIESTGDIVTVAGGAQAQGQPRSALVNTYVFRPVRPVLSAGWHSRICARCGKRWNVHDRVLRNPLPCVCGANEVPLTLGQALALTLSRYCVQCEAHPFEACPMHDPNGLVVAAAQAMVMVHDHLKNARAR